MWISWKLSVKLSSFSQARPYTWVLQRHFQILMQQCNCCQQQNLPPNQAQLQGRLSSETFREQDHVVLLSVEDPQYQCALPVKGHHTTAGNLSQNWCEGRKGNSFCHNRVGAGKAQCLAIFLFHLRNLSLTLSTGFSHSCFGSACYLSQLPPTDRCSER